MHLHFAGVNDAFHHLVEGVHLGSIPTARSPSRVGDVLQVTEPMVLTYRKPTERVLFNVARDANPFFHLYEALWMLAGRQDIAPLEYYASGYGDHVRDDYDRSDTANGAYGKRWRRAWYHPDSECDQLEVLVDHLKAKPESRRAVLQMWNIEDDLLKIDVSKDVCCNLCVCFSIRRVIVDPRDPVNADDYNILDMTVFNRSNDLVWGTLGSDFVTFSVAQEYVACALGVKVGKYHQVSNNLHCYTERWRPTEWLACETGEAKRRYYPEFDHVPLVQDRATFDGEVIAFVEMNSRSPMTLVDDHWAERFLNCTAQPMMNAFHCHKARVYNLAKGWAATIEADDWRRAATEWIQRRQHNWESKNAGSSAEKS